MTRFFRNSFRNRLFAAMLAASLVPLLLCTAMMVQITRLQMDSKNESDAAEQSRILNQSMDAVSTGLASAVRALESSSTVTDALLRGQADRFQVNTLLFDATESARSFAAFDLYDKDGRCLYTTQGTPSSQPLPTNWGILYSAAQKPGIPAYVACEDPADVTQPLLKAAVLLRDTRAQNAGYLVMRMYVAGFRALLDGKYPQSDILVLSPFFRPIYSSQSYLNTTIAPTLREQLLSGQPLEEDTFIYSVTRHEPTGLFLVLRQPRMFTDSTVRLLYIAGIICGLMGILISVIVSLPLSRQISLPIRRLQKAFDKVQQDDLETQVRVQGQDELGQLASRFNGMVSALKSNREELLRNQQELNEAQIRMLQAQLNPHFLCNTLDTMKWISKINKVPQVALMSTNLADILRFCISAEEFVPLYREIEILHRYIEIQKIRLSDNFAFSVEVEEELYDCLVPKMVLQPIVENAVLHGLNGVEAGRISVKAESAGADCLRIVVTDNGMGFPEGMRGRPYRRDKTLAKGHLGLYNVDTILRRFYGEEWGLYLDSGENGTGASVTAMLPIRYEEGSEEC